MNQDYPFSKYYKISDLCFHITAYRVFWRCPFFFLEMQPDLVLFTGTPLPSAWHATIYCDHNACHSVQIFSLSLFFFLLFFSSFECLSSGSLFISNIEISEDLTFLSTWLLIYLLGDFGNENVEVVRSIANLKMPKAAILGNHDCWYTHQFSEK